MGVATVVVVAIILVAGCKDFPGADGRYATPPRGGWDNFRAEAPPNTTDMMTTAAKSQLLDLD